MSPLELIKEAGIVGAGGAGFPTHVKLAAKAEFVLLNGAECEPLLRVDQQLMEMMPEKIVTGLNIAKELTGAEKAIIGIKGKHKHVIEILKSAISSLNLEETVEIGVLPDVYPAGDEQVLVYELVKRVVPEAGIPLNVGCVVINTETALNICEAVNGKSVTETYITLAGDIPKPVTVKVLVGTKIIDVLKLSGIDDFSGYSVIDGGPMMGPMLKDFDGYITKKNKGFIILKSTHGLVQRKSVNSVQAKKVNKATCEQCRMCTDLCPRYMLGHNIQPHKTMRLVGYGINDETSELTTQLCCLCNLCELFSCPAGLYPRMANNSYKEKTLSEGKRYKPIENTFTVHPLRPYRMLPSKRLVYRLGLYKFDRPAPYEDITQDFSEVSIMLRQHVGAPAVACVSIGETVTRGQKIGDIKENALGATVHSSIDGTVAEINNNFIRIRR